MSRRSQRTDDGTPLSIIQEELFELQRQRRQVELQTPKGPPPDMPYYASVAPPNTSTKKFSNTPTPTPTGPVPREYDNDVEQPKPVVKKISPKKKQSDPVQVNLQDPTEIQVPLVQERTSSETVRRVKIGLVLTLLLFICMYAYPVLSNVPPEKRASALSTLSVAVGLGAIGSSLWPMMEKATP